ncbi:hypothetical protein B7990_13140 [Fibrobacter sp. UWB4]|uniref:hypothetical protein n=1 Tax=Fibrobacter sp. UWB4 TaxID=1964356 RepID=UPI000B524B17|nr:hypothetical protein [Fibrobacter sp. UWB4]OWV15740.1 hypothetical protein B7990_13140 [Fibrobacter sp. UWB4]
MRKLSFFMLIVFAIQLTGCLGLAYRMSSLEKTTFAPSLSDAYKKNIGLDTVYNVGAGGMTIEQIQEKTHPAVRDFLLEFIQKDEFDYKKYLKFNLVEGFIMDAVMKKDDDENATVYLVHVNYGGEKDDSLREKLKAVYDLWYINGRVTRLMRRIGDKIIYDMDVEKKYELEYYDDGQVMSEYRGEFLNDTDGASRYNGTYTIYSERGKKAIECEISDLRVEKESCKKWDEKVDLNKVFNH